MSAAKAGAHQGLTYRAGAIDWETFIVITITDASFANEVKIVNDLVLPRRSQGGRLTVIASPDFWTCKEAKNNIYVIGWKSGMIKRVCRSTMQAETQSLVLGVEEGIRIRAAVADMRGMQNRTNWQEP